MPSALLMSLLFVCGCRQIVTFSPMGCNSSKQAEEEAAAAAEKQRKRDEANAAMNAPRVDPKDFMLVKLKDQTIVKEPGSAQEQERGTQ